MRRPGIRTIFASLLLLVLSAPALAMAASSEIAGGIVAGLPAGKAETVNIAGSGAAAQPAIPAGESTPWSELGARAGKKYSGEALSVIATETGARLRSDFQRLHGEVTEQGLTLESTVTGQPSERFTLRADAMGREGRKAVELPRLGRVETRNGLARWLRPGMVEEYSVSVEGVRQDFVITERPAGDGPLRLELALSSARAETASYGARLTLGESGRKLAYSRLKALDATGRELHAHMSASGPDRLTVVVEDSGAVWPVRIDPTFSDANWIGMGTNGLNSDVLALAIDGSGNLYAGGNFTATSDSAVSANYIAKWNGSAWSPLGTGVSGGSPTNVAALAIDGTGNLYAGGNFITAGGVSANYIAKWNGSAWSPLGTGMNGAVYALAIDGSTGYLYAGGNFTATSDSAVSINYIATWDGNSWFPTNSIVPGNGTSAAVRALAIYGTQALYVGGDFTSAGGLLVNYIALMNRFTGSWSGLYGMNGPVYALAIDGTGNLFAGGTFFTAGGVSANYIAKWDGNAWSPLGSGMTSYVRALAIHGTGNLYAGGIFTTAGGVSANYIAEWDGSAWSPLGSGVSGGSAPYVDALAIDGTGNLYAGGGFTTAGGKSSSNIAKATPLRVKRTSDGTLYASIQDAYASVSSGSITIQAQTYSFPEDLLFGNVTTVTLTGGMDSNFNPTAGYTTVKSLTVGNGSVVIGNITIN